MRMHNVCITMQELSVIELIKNNKSCNEPRDKLEWPE